MNLGAAGVREMDSSSAGQSWREDGDEEEGVGGLWRSLQENLSSSSWLVKSLQHPGLEAPAREGTQVLWGCPSLGLHSFLPSGRSFIHSSSP